MKFLFLLPALLAATLVSAQIDGAYGDYDWEPIPIIYTPEAEDLNEDVITVFEKQSHEYNYYSPNMQRYELLHIKKHLLSDKAIEQENKFYVRTGGSKRILKLKARVIQPSGKIVEMNEDNIIESKDENGKVRYRYFAFEGIEKGSTIEYLHYIFFKEEETHNHKYVDLNGDSKKKKFNFSVLLPPLGSPQLLKLSLATYSNNPNYSMSRTSDNDRLIFELSLENVGKIPKERYAHPSKNQHRMFYTIDVPTGNNNSSYDIVSRNLNSYFQQGQQFTRKPFKKMIEDFVAQALSPTDTTNLQKLRAVERRLKEEYGFVTGPFDTWQKIEKTKTIDEQSAFAYMIEAGRYLGIDTKLAITCDRDELLFPRSHKSYVFLRQIMLYFPSEQAFFRFNPKTRIGPASSSFIGNNALYIKLSDAFVQTPVNEITTIPVPPVTYSTDSIHIATTIDPATLQATIQLDRSVSGYFAEPYQAEMSLLTAEQLHEVKEQFFTYVLTKSATLGDYTFENDNSAAFNDKPLVGHVTATSSSLVSEAGGKLLVNIGTLIGPQSNMYQEKPETRQSPVDLDYLHRYTREIRLTIPEGYKVANPEDMNSNVIPDARQSIGFTSSYEILDNELVIKIKEWYNELTYPKEQYRSVVNVFNAAADFNALTLVLEKQ